MNRVQRHGGAMLLALGVSACQAPAPPVLAPAAMAAAQPPRQRAANDDGAAPSPVRQGHPGPEEEVSVALDHAGEVVVGQRLDDVRDLGPWAARGTLVTADGICTYYEGPGLPEGISMRVDDDHVVRFDLGQGPEPDALTGQPGPFGIRLGMSRAEAEARLPATAVWTPSDGADGAGDYLVWQDPSTDLALGLELFEGQVIRMYWGISEAVELIEGCA